MAGDHLFLPVSDQFSPSYVPIPDGSMSQPATRRVSNKVLSGISLLLLLGLVGLALIPAKRQENVAVKLKPGVSRGVDAGVSEKANREFLGKSVMGYPWNNSLLSWQRTAFHFQPEKNWMSDPNGPLFYKGWYHFFYQYNPRGAVWANMVWGHAVSRDLIHWLHLPFAMVPDQASDIGGVFSGSATILPDGKVVMLYTGATEELVQVQNLAHPEDPDDPLLLKWVKHPGNPILTQPPGILPKDFRDPTTAWLTSEGKWRMAIGSKIDRTGIVLIYDTEDFINYNLSSKLLHTGVPGTGIWECVDFYPVSTTNKNGLDTSVNGPEVRHVVKASMEDDRHDYYAIGTYNEKDIAWYPDHPEIDVGVGLRYDYGVFYASKSFYDQNKQRRVLWGYVHESDSEALDVQRGWACVQGIPRTIVLDQKTGSNLLLWPVEEVESLRLENKTFDKVEVKAGSVIPLDLEGATQLDIVAEFEIDETTLESTAEANEEFSCSTSGGAAQRGALGPFGLLVLADESLVEQTPVYFYITKGSNGSLKTFFCTDQTRSSLANDVNKEIYGGHVPVLKDEKFSVRVLVDHSIIEIFAQGGRTGITSRVYPTRAIYDSAKLFLFNNATEGSVTSSLKIWQMSAAFSDPYTEGEMVN